MNLGIGSMLGTITSFLSTLASPGGSTFSSCIITILTLSSSSSSSLNAATSAFLHSFIFGVSVDRRDRPAPAGVFRFTDCLGFGFVAAVLAMSVNFVTSSLVVQLAMVAQSFGSPDRQSYALRAPITSVEAVPPAPVRA